jgi:membrane protease YdiL (CAAX protease family)
MSFIVDQNATPPQSPPWGIPATIAWLLVAFLVSLVGAAAVFSTWQGGQPTASVTYDGVLIAIGTLASVPVQIGVLAVAAQMRKWTPRAYFALIVPRRGELVFALICILALDLAFDALLYVTGRDLVPAFQMEAYQSAKDTGWLAGLALAIVVVAPIGEEIAFRGFFYRGLARPGHEMMAIGLIALVWAMLHFQYDWMGMVQIFTVGVMLGWFRWATGSTVLTIVMHMVVNIEAMIETAIKMELMS